jgi:hypothetical protein
MIKTIDRTISTLHVVDEDGEKKVTEVGSMRREVRMDRDGYFSIAEKFLPQVMDELYTENTFRPRDIVLVYTEQQDYNNGETEFRLASATISGPRLLKNNRPSKNRIGDNTYRHTTTDTPSWLALLISQFDPTGPDRPYQA